MRNFLCCAALLSLAPLTAQGDAKKSVIPEDTEIVATKTGLKYSVLKKGDGRKPKKGDIVTVHYTGWLPNGTQFDSSRQGGTPFTFTVGGRVIAGWNQGVQYMSKGARFKFTVPPELGYGDRGQGKIPPKSTLIFDVEVLSIVHVPEFKKLDPKKTKTTESGLKYEVLTEGTGATPKDDQMAKFEFAYWDLTGRMYEFSRNPDMRLVRKVSEMPLPFLKEAAKLMKVGSRYRFEVPSGIGIRQLGNTIWVLHLEDIVKPLPIPKFSMSPANKLKTTASGLKYEIIKAGKGKRPTSTQEVSVHYAGWLTNGELFDSSFSRGQPAKFPLNRVISGWTEGVQLMQEGAIYKFTIPGGLAYGPQGSPPKIGPNATLVFYIELIKVH